ncbi:retrovirus-related pol polyprotein from transposon TNT 1-94 [Tanacetum coccineum]
MFLLRHLHPRNANGFNIPQTVISEGAPVVTESLVPHQIPLTQTLSDSDIETRSITVTWTQAHSLENIIGDKDRPVSTRKQLETDAMWCFFNEFLTHVEPKTYKQALEHSCWIEAMQEEIHEFERLDVWILVPCPDNILIIPLKWIFKIKWMSRWRRLEDKARIVDPEHPSHVYRLKKALYGLKQAPRAWYDKLSAFLIKSGFTKGVVDPTLFTRKAGKHILLVQIYVDDIIFASTNPKACKLFAFEMNSTFKMSMMGQMSFFLGLQVSQSPRGIFINQSKYAQEILKKFGFVTCTPIDTPMAERPDLDEDKGGKLIDPTRFRGMVGSLMYLSASRPDIEPINMGLWYPKDSGFDLKALQMRLAVSHTQGEVLQDAVTNPLDAFSTPDTMDLRSNKIPIYCDNQVLSSML